jgi:hypothetical protein
VAQNNGGGLIAGPASNVVADGSMFSNNTAGNCGGGVHAWGDVVVFLIDGSSVERNTANMTGGGVCARQEAKVTITSSSVQGNTAAKGGDGVFIQDTAKVDTSGSSVQANTAQRGLSAALPPALHIVVSTPGHVLVPYSLLLVAQPLT